VFKIYFWLSGEVFDPDSFQTIHGHNLNGSVAIRKRIKNDIVEYHGKYWKSEVREGIQNKPEDELLNMLQQYRTVILQARSLSATQIVAEIVAEFSSLEDVRGFYFSSQTITLLEELGMSVDIDILVGGEQTISKPA
jgi:hypothetical protein